MSLSPLHRKIADIFTAMKRYDEQSITMWPQEGGVGLRSICRTSEIPESILSGFRSDLSGHNLEEVTRAAFGLAGQNNLPSLNIARAGNVPIDDLVDGAGFKLRWQPAGPVWSKFPHGPQVAGRLSIDLVRSMTLAG